MRLFGKKSSFKESGIFKGFVDWHSHILPGVDDGISGMEEALDALAEFERLGFRKVWLTPHVMEDYPNETAFLKTRFDELQHEWKGDLEIGLGSENMLDSLFEQRLENNDLLPFGEDGKHLLVETSYYTPPYGMDDMLDQIKKKGYHIILAHPERYTYMEEKDYIKYHDMGLKFQMNLMSLLGSYGEMERKKALWLLKKNYVNFLGTDIHRLISLNNRLEKPVLNGKQIQSLANIKG